MTPEQQKALNQVYKAFGTSAIVLREEDFGDGPMYYGTWTNIKRPIGDILAEIAVRCKS